MKNKKILFISLESCDKGLVDSVMLGIPLTEALR